MFPHPYVSYGPPPPAPLLSRDDNDREVFVGNLSFFCVEEDLLYYFSQYAEVETTRIVRNDDQTRSLLYGFVSFATVREADEIKRIFNNHMFMGRVLRIKSSSIKHKSETVEPIDYQVYVEFDSAFTNICKDLVVPNELLLRKHFNEFGSIVDVKVRAYCCEEGNQKGGAFLAFYYAGSALNCVRDGNGVSTHQGITFKCSHTHASRKHNGQQQRKSPLIPREQFQMAFTPGYHPTMAFSETSNAAYSRSPRSENLLFPNYEYGSL